MLCVSWLLAIVTIVLNIVPNTSEKRYCDAKVGSNPCECIVPGLCTLNCIGKDRCKGANFALKCMAGYPCDINCNSDGEESVCQDAMIDASTATDVNVICRDSKSCQNLQIQCGTGRCNVFCINSGFNGQECDGLILNCGHDICTIECQKGIDGLITTCNNVIVNIQALTRGFQCIPPGINNQECNIIDSMITPFIIPTASPSTSPTPSPTYNPTKYPTLNPTENTFNPTIYPTNNPTYNPSLYPTIDPTSDPSNHPTNNPTLIPTNNPTIFPTKDPTIDPTSDPSNYPTNDPTKYPTNNPTNNPTMDPTMDPTKYPTTEPSIDPTNNPTVDPTIYPTSNPTIYPTKYPTSNPTKNPSTTTTTYPPINDSIVIIIIDNAATQKSSNSSDIIWYIAIPFAIVSLCIFEAIFLFFCYKCFKNNDGERKENKLNHDINKSSMDSSDYDINFSLTSFDTNCDDCDIYKKKKEIKYMTQIQEKKSINLDINDIINNYKMKQLDDGDEDEESEETSVDDDDDDDNHNHLY